MSPPDDAPSFLTTAASIVGVGSSRNTRNGAGVAGAAVALTHLQGNARTFLRQIGYVPSDWCGNRTAKSFLHDTAFHCDNCEDWFLNASAMADEEDQPEYGKLCFWCRWNLRMPEDRAVAAQALAVAA